MSAKGNLFLLIKSMSKTEKIQFKRFYSDGKKETKNYIRLFDFMDSMKKDDDQFIREKFKGEKFVIQLSVAKNFLFQQIMESLVYYHKDDLGDVFLSRSVAKSELLIRKGLYKDAEKIITDAITFCEEREKQLYLPIFIQKLRRIYLYEHRIEFCEIPEEYSKLEKEALIASSEQSTVEWNYLSIRSLALADLHPNLKRSKVRALIDDLQASDIKSNRFVSNYFKIHAEELANYILNGKTKESAFVFESLIQRYQEHSYLSTEEPLLWGNLLMAKLNFALAQKNTKEITSILDEIQLQMESNRVDFLNLVNRYYPALLHSFIVREEWKAGIDFLRKNQNVISELSYTIQKESLLLVYGNAAIIYYHGNFFSDAFRMLNMLSGISTRNFMFYRNFLDLFWLMMQMEREEWDLIDYRINQIAKRIQRSKDLIGYELALIRAFRTIARNPERLNIIAQMNVLQTVLNGLAKDPTMVVLKESFDVNKWIKIILLKYSR
jgi:hypothetical protein